MFKANEIIPVPHLHFWQTNYDSVVACIEKDSTPSPYYTSQGYMFLGETSLIFTVRSDFNEVADKINALETKIATETKEFQETIGRLKREIQKLQAIENSPTVTEPDDDIPF